MKRWSGNLFVLFCLGGVSFGATVEKPSVATDTAQENLGSLEVTGSAKDKVEIEKATHGIKIDVRELVDSVTEKTEKLLDQGPTVPSEEDFSRLNRLSSTLTARPWLPDLAEPPLIRFKPAPSSSRVIRWRLEVTDIQGEIVHVISGMGNPVSTVVWDGFDKTGAMIRVGEVYSFRFVTVDEFKSTHTTLGESFVLNHLKYRDKKNLIIEISSAWLFKDENFVPDALPILDRAVDVLREYSIYPFVVECHTRGASRDWATSRQQKISEKLTHDLLLGDNNVRVLSSGVKDRGDVFRFVIKL